MKLVFLTALLTVFNTTTDLNFGNQEYWIGRTHKQILEKFSHESYYKFSRIQYEDSTTFYLYSYNETGSPIYGVGFGVYEGKCISLMKLILPEFIDDYTLKLINDGAEDLGYGFWIDDKKGYLYIFKEYAARNSNEMVHIIYIYKKGVK